MDKGLFIRALPAIRTNVYTFLLLAQSLDLCGAKPRPRDAGQPASRPPKTSLQNRLTNFIRHEHAHINLRASHTFNLSNNPGLSDRLTATMKRLATGLRSSGRRRCALSDSTTATPSTANNSQRTLPSATDRARHVSTQASRPRTALFFPGIYDPWVHGYLFRQSSILTTS